MTVTLAKLRAAAFAVLLGIAGLAGSVTVAQAQSPESVARGTIAVDSFSGAELTLGAASPEGLSAILIEALIRDGRFDVVEAGSPNVGMLVKGAITRFNPGAGGGGVQVGGLPIGGGARTRRVTLGVSLRFIDAATGRIVAIATAEGSASAQEADAGLQNQNNGSTVGATAFRSTSIGKAVQDAINRALAKASF